MRIYIEKRGGAHHHDNLCFRVLPVHALDELLVGVDISLGGDVICLVVVIGS